jgi:hypothetical protein
MVKQRKLYVSLEKYKWDAYSGDITGICTTNNIHA